jgi:hypothetical protein
LRAIERMSHRRDAARIDGLEPVDEGHDARKLGRDVGYLGGGDLQASELTKPVDVFRSKHGFLLRFLSCGMK